MALGILESKAEAQPPGTYFLVDTSQTSAEHHYEHSHFKHGKGKVRNESMSAVCTYVYLGQKNNIILVPQPSDDPNDPLVRYYFHGPPSNH
jgi:hypothetical protein